MNAFSIVPITMEHIDGFRDCFDEVARERQYLAMLEAPPREQVKEFVLGNILNNAAQFLALADDRVVGWCDAFVKPRATLAHSGVLGMGVRSAYRGRGIGRALIEKTLEAARERSLTRIELTVRTDNLRAKRLYESVGFVEEGVCRNHIRVDGKYYDSYLMAILLE